LNEIDKGVTVEKTVTMGETQYKLLLAANRRWREGFETLRAERDRLRDALEKLIERADDSDDARYGTMSTTYVRDIARAALKGDTF